MSPSSIRAHERRIAAVGVRMQDDTRIVDLRSTGWIDPLHLVCIAALAQGAAVDGVPFELRGLDSDQLGYAARMRLGQALDDHGAVHGLPTVREHDRRDVLSEVTQLTRAADVRAMAALVHDKVAPTDAVVAAGLYNSLAEISANVCEHAQSVGFVAAQTIPSQGVIRFAVADTGVGMLHTLRDRGATDARTAISMALSGTSSVDEATHGKGLPSVVRDLGTLDGQLMIASHDAVTAADRSGRSHLMARSPFPGTVLEGWIPLHQGRHASTLTRTNAP